VLRFRQLPKLTGVRRAHDRGNAASEIAGDTAAAREQHHWKWRPSIPSLAVRRSHSCETLQLCVRFDVDLFGRMIARRLLAPA
jgi:hypothetical protein